MEIRIDLFSLFFECCVFSFCHFRYIKVVSGSPLQAQQYHEPLCSFDSNGRYTGLASLVELLGGTAIPVEPESPDILYESVVSVPTEQQSPEVAQHARAEDDTQIMMQVL